MTQSADREKALIPGLLLFEKCGDGGVLFEDIVHICLQISFRVLKDAKNRIIVTSVVVEGRTKVAVARY
jgi:hypothetical protein